MVKTKDQKQCFTHEKNLPQLMEFSKTFGAEISTVQIPSESEVLELEELALALCEKKTQKVEYTLLEIKLQPKRDRKTILSRAKKIQKHIEKNLLNGEVVSLKKLSNKFKNKQLTVACLCNHFKIVRLKMEKQGRVFVKIGGGKYKLQ
jgi:hypothetical protein